LLLQWEKHLNVIADKAEVWYVASTSHCNKYIKIFVLPYCWKLLFIIPLAHRLSS